jgi:hypothetical protein
MDEAVVMLAEYTKKRDAEKKETNFKTLDSNEVFCRRTDESL